MATIFLTGSAGFIGYHVAKSLLKNGHQVVGLDNLNSYYSVQLKQDRLAQFGIEINDQVRYQSGNYTFFKADLENKDLILELFKEFKFDYVVHLAAQAGV
ncbi:MAG: NAD-dependent epimerase/dehydratase family protein, partial [Bacteroidetes bacterium]|nr:NAD-dependent epimerase/dehydratase family protein [Bacteroidota bacterium]